MLILQRMANELHSSPTCSQILEDSARFRFQKDTHRRYWALLLLASSQRLYKLKNSRQLHPQYLSSCAAKTLMLWLAICWSNLIPYRSHIGLLRDDKQGKAQLVNESHYCRGTRTLRTRTLLTQRALTENRIRGQQQRDSLYTGSSLDPSKRNFSTKAWKWAEYL